MLMNLKTSFIVLATFLSVAECFLNFGNANSRPTFSPMKVVNLALAASKSAYLPPLQNVDIFGKIKGNWDTMPKLPTVLIGTLSDLLPQPNVFSILPKQIYNPLFDWPACNTLGWFPTWKIGIRSKVLMLQHKPLKLVVFAFRGKEAYSLEAIRKTFMANISRDGLPAHMDFVEQYNDVAKWFRNNYRKIPSDHKIVVTGYDIGGPQAYIAALDAVLNLERRPDAVITFGSPTVGNLKFRRQYTEHVGCDRTISISTIQDIFTRFPVGAIRPCNDTPVNAGDRPVNPAEELLKEIFIKAFPEVVPQVIQNLLPEDIKEPINKIFPPEKQGKVIQDSMGTVAKLYDDMLDLEYAHNLYQGYEKGIKKLYEGNSKGIDLDCNKHL